MIARNAAIERCRKPRRPTTFFKRAGRKNGDRRGQWTPHGSYALTPLTSDRFASKLDQCHAGQSVGVDGPLSLVVCHRWIWIDAEFLADMGKLFRIGEAAVHHHPPECRQASLGEEQSWQMDTGIKPHQATRNQSFRDRRQLRLASVGTAAPRLELKALGDARQGREEDVQFAAN